MSDFKYRAFISYTASDEKWAIWLQRELERYRIPKELRGTKGKYGIIPTKLTPIFRDKSDLEVNHDLSQRLKKALDESLFLIVLCSPEAAGSSWVNDEISYFQKIGREDRILCLVVGGDPVNNSCFPPALLNYKQQSASQAIAKPPVTSPLAADIRESQDSKTDAKLKIISAMIGITMTEFSRRESISERRRIRIIKLLSIVFLILSIFASTSAGIAFYQREKAIEAEVIAKDNFNIAVSSLENVILNVSRSFQTIEGMPPGVLEDTYLKMAIEVKRLKKKEGYSTTDARLGFILLTEMAQVYKSMGNKEGLMVMIAQLDDFSEDAELLLEQSDYPILAKLNSLAFERELLSLTFDKRAIQKSFEVDEYLNTLSSTFKSRYRRELSDLSIVNLMQLGDIYYYHENFFDSEKAYYRALELIKTMFLDFEHNLVDESIGYYEDLVIRNKALILERLAGIAENKSNLENAIGYYEEVIRIYTKLADSNPQRFVHRLDIAKGKARLSNIFNQKKNEEKAIDLMLSAISIFEEINSSNPGRLDVLTPFSTALLDTAQLYDAQGEINSVIKYSRLSLQYGKSLLAMSPNEDIIFRFSTATSLLSDKLEKQGAILEAVEHLNFFVKYIESNPDNLYDTLKLMLLSDMYFRLGIINRHFTDSNNERLYFKRNTELLTMAIKYLPKEEYLINKLKIRLMNRSEFLLTNEYISGYAEEAYGLASLLTNIKMGVFNVPIKNVNHAVEKATVLSRLSFASNALNQIETSINYLTKAVATLPEKEGNYEWEEKRFLWTCLLAHMRLLQKDYIEAFKYAVIAESHYKYIFEVNEVEKTSSLLFHLLDIKDKKAWLLASFGMLKESREEYESITAGVKSLMLIYPENKGIRIFYDSLTRNLNRLEEGRLLDFEMLEVSMGEIVKARPQNIF